MLAAFLILSLWVPLPMFNQFNYTPTAGVSTPATGIVVTLVGVLVALAGHLLTQGRNAGESLEKRSRFYLDSCIQAYEEAQKLLLDGNNDRATWIAAGRTLKHAEELSGQVSIDAHLRVLEIQKLKYRGFFHDLLKDKTASFFYGAEDPTITIDDAAKLSTARRQRSGRNCVSSVNELSEKSLRAIWQAAQFPEEYRDPLNERFSDAERDRLLVLFPGLHEFLEHKEQWHSSAGKLYRRDEASDL